MADGNKRLGGKRIFRFVSRFRLSPRCLSSTDFRRNRAKSDNVKWRISGLAPGASVLCFSSERLVYVQSFVLGTFVRRSLPDIPDNGPNMPRERLRIRCSVLENSRSSHEEVCNLPIYSNVVCVRNIAVGARFASFHARFREKHKFLERFSAKSCTGRYESCPCRKFHTRTLSA